MSSSVSSERAFSQGGITISKQRNQLKGDIVEALRQCVKCAIRHDLLFRGPAPSSILEAELNGDDEDGENNGSESDHAEGWDDLLEIDDEAGSDTESDSC